MRIPFKSLLWSVLALTIPSLAGGDEPAIDYPDHADLSHYRDAGGQVHPIRTIADWEIRRQHIRDNLQRVMGPVTNPGPTPPLPLDVHVIEEQRAGTALRRKLTFQSDRRDRIPAYVMLPTGFRGKRPAMLCLHQTTAAGKDEPAGVRGDPQLAYAKELVERGYVVLVPDYPSLGEYTCDFSKEISGSMKAVRDNIRGVDLLCSLPEVDGDRIGVIGHSLGGHNALFTACFEPRLRVIVCSCGFSTFRKDDLPSWTSPRYMPRIATLFGNEVSRVPFDFDEVVASLAPRPFLACAAQQDDDFDVSGVRDVMAAARTVYQRYDAADHLAADYPAAKHSFPAASRTAAYEFVDRFLVPAGACRTGDGVD